MRLFCAFVRLPTRDQSLVSGQAVIEPDTPLGIRQDVEAVMQMMGSRAKSRITLERIADFKLDLRGADLPTAQFLDADLSNALFYNSNLSGANFANTDLTDCFLIYSDLSRAQFYNVNFTRTGLRSADLSGALLEGANLSGTSFLRTDLSGARLAMAEMSGAQFLDADLTSADIAGANLSGVEFSIGGLQTAKGLTQAQLDDARADPNNPPELTGVLDAGSGEPLVWRGKLLNDEAWGFSEPVRGDVA